MLNADKPIFVIALRDEFVGSPVPYGWRDSMSCFGTREEAEAVARQLADQAGHPASLYRIAEYSFTGNVTEVQP